MAGILGDGNAFLVKRLLIKFQRFIGCTKKTGTRVKNGGKGKNGDESK
jgi:hypothetical protein